MKSLAILGASGHGKVLADIALLNGYECIQFFDDRYPELKKIGCWAVLGNTSNLLSCCADYSSVIIGIGHNSTRLRKQIELEKVGAHLATLVHPTAVISTFSTIQPGSAVMAGAVVNAFATVGKAAIVNTAATVDHDCQLGDAIHISPGAHLAGSVNVGDCTWIGIGACVIQCLTLGANVVVGAGSTVINSVCNDTTVVGSPAKPISHTL
ncbi:MULTISPECIES: acetyltransferase [Pseudomonadati]|uniref:Acetyltransferase n=1 Tax=Shewanella aestuarii TaxID=1028752 RepID=A0ABT0L1T5_9GAMM|nr:acetyltransferase [Shewanella aestuarii]MCL1117662.1 acetyltransferase [Shewanella aestuarii]GGN76362.1 hypothetical protein GCM10009193_17570 [Shewanella aestuarii]